MPSVSIVIWEMKRDRDAPLKARKSGRCGPVNTYRINMLAMIGRAGPITRRVASSRRTTSMRPKMMSRVVGTPAREAMPS